MDENSLRVMGERNTKKLPTMPGVSRMIERNFALKKSREKRKEQGRGEKNSSKETRGQSVPTKSE